MLNHTYYYYKVFIKYKTEIKTNKKYHIKLTNTHLESESDNDIGVYVTVKGLRG